MMARRAVEAVSRPPQLMVPRVSGVRPMAARNSVVLPAPFGPISRVGAPACSVSDTRSRMVTLPAAMVASVSTIGRSVAGARMLIPRSVRRPGARPRPMR